MSVDAATALLRWYDANARALPWRVPPGAATTPDPYRVWLSEIMLQQTSVAAATPYFERFVLRWPDMASLAAADEAELMAAWAGLGYYARARNLIACARAIAGDHGGHFPDSEEALRRLPGVGAYTAAAIAAIAFGRRAVVIDANVERVVARLFAIPTPLPQARAAIRAAADAITPAVRAGDFAQAMMDLGSRVCVPREPRCLACPIADGCLGRLSGAPGSFPVRPAKLERPHRRGIAWWLERDGAVLLRRRPARGLLGGMRALPSGDWAAGEPAGDPPATADWAPIGAVVHVFTHFALTLQIRAARGAAGDVEGEWWPVERIAEAGLPTVFARTIPLASAWRELVLEGAA